MSDNTLPFLELDQSGRSFEDFCVRLAMREKGISWAVHKDRGKKQYGVDVEGYSVENKPVLVISCKRVTKATPSNIDEWLNEFLNHWDSHWKDKGVQTFVLALTVEPNTKLNDAINRNTPAFSNHGISLIPWWPVRLTDKAISSPLQLILPFFDEESARSVCGPSVMLNFRAFCERNFDAEDEVRTVGTNIIPTTNNYRQGFLHLPDILNNVEKSLHEFRLAYVLGSGASGKTVLGNLIASKRHRYQLEHARLCAEARDAYALTDYCAYVRLSADSTEPDIQHDLRCLADAKTLVVVDDVHLNTDLAKRIFSEWQRLTIKPYILFLGRKTTRQHIKSFGINGSPIELTTDYRVVRGIFSYICANKCRGECAILNDEVFKQWAVEFGANDGTNVDLVALSYAIHQEYERQNRNRTWKLKIESAVEAVWEWHLRNISDKEIYNLLQLAAIPDDMGLASHALRHRSERFSAAEANGVVWSETIHRTLANEIRYRPSHAALRRLIRAAAEGHGFVDKKVHEIREELFERDPLSGILIALHEARSDEGADGQSMHEFIQSLNNVDWIEKYATRGGLDTIRAFIACGDSSDVGRQGLLTFLQNLLRSNGLKLLFMRTPLRNRAEFIRTVEKVVRAGDVAEASPLPSELFRMQFSEENIEQTLEVMRREPLSGIIRMLEISVAMNFNDAALLTRDESLSRDIVNDAIIGNQCLNEFVPLLQNEPTSAFLSSLRSEFISALRCKSNTGLLVRKMHEEPAHMLSKFLALLREHTPRCIYDLYVREISDAENVSRIYEKIAGDMEAMNRGALKQLIDLLEFMVEDGSADLQRMGAQILLRITSEEARCGRIVSSMSVTQASDLFSCCRDVDVLASKREDANDKNSLPLALANISDVIEKYFQRGDLRFFRASIESGPIDALISWFKEPDAGGCCVKAGGNALLRELLLPETIHRFANRLCKERQTTILALLNRENFKVVLGEVRKLVKRADWHPKREIGPHAKSVEARLNSALDMLYDLA